MNETGPNAPAGEVMLTRAQLEARRDETRARLTEHIARSTRLVDQLNAETAHLRGELRLLEALLAPPKGGTP